ncbi:uncharacterized protein Dana_GF21126, isoform C [Drosophila ananassae]|uniref:Uncharacterized protein, isoform C n=1 Tax=Drosophila ananassae TaxID=7217 RepID=A0A0P9A9J7_DROAN|nr:uncharacterized protein LOC6503815 isoform X2 [Drosophila ananassae]KPU74992.1 uncharacterized protein Dana_GF21126, isoform C [Drosophila ananassae]
MIQLPKCCPCIPLWLGCLINALVLFAVDLLENPLPYDVHCCDSLKAILFVLDRVCNIVHIMGCCSLFVASFGQSVLVKVFLGTSIVHFVMHPVHLVAKIDVPAIIWEDVVLSVLAAGGSRPSPEPESFSQSPLFQFTASTSGSWPSPSTASASRTSSSRTRRASPATRSARYSDLHPRSRGPSCNYTHICLFPLETKKKGELSQRSSSVSGLRNLGRGSGLPGGRSAS